MLWEVSACNNNNISSFSFLSARSSALKVQGGVEFWPTERVNCQKKRLNETLF